MSSKRGTARQWSSGGQIKDSKADQVYAALQKAVRVEHQALSDGIELVSLPELGGLPALRAPRRPRSPRAGAPLPHPKDIHAVLAHAAASLHALAREHSELRTIERALTRYLVGGVSLDRAFHYLRRGRGAPRYRGRIRGALLRSLEALERRRYSKRPELRYVRLALRRHLELGLTLRQAFGYERVTRGAAPHPEEREQRIACEVFERRFLNKGLNAEVAGYETGKRYGVGKTQALAAFKAHAAYALRFHKAQRLESGQTSLWTVEEARRLHRYYGPLLKRAKEWFDSQPRK